MTKDEALKLALSALNEVRQETFRLMKEGQTLYAEKKVWEAIYTIKKVLAQPEQEPVGEIVDAIEGAFKCSFTKMLPVGTKLYTTPPPCPTCEALARTVMMDQTGRDL